MEEFLKATGTLEVILKDQYGNIKDSRKVSNIVTTVGKTFIASRMAGTSSAVMSHMAIGSSTTPAAVGDTALGGQLGITTLSVSGGTPSGGQVAYSATFAAGTGTGAVAEAGIFNAASSGTMLCRTTFSTVNKGASDSLTINWTVQIN